LEQEAAALRLIVKEQFIGGLTEETHLLLDTHQQVEDTAAVLTEKDLTGMVKMEAQVEVLVAIKHQATEQV
jgi:hypothetical protein